MSGRTRRLGGAPPVNVRTPSAHPVDVRPPAARPEPTRPIIANGAPPPAVPAWLPPGRPDHGLGDGAEPEGGDPQRTSVLPPAGPAPVFMDASGRRARLVRRLGILAGAALTTYLLVIGVSLALDTDVPLTPWPTGTAKTQGPSGNEPNTPSGDPSPESSSPSSRATGARSTPPPTGTAGNGGAAPSATSTPTRTQRGNAPVTPPAHGRNKPKPNG